MEDLGRDMASVQGLQRKHEGHERELLVVQQQVDTLNAESAKLQAAYQGSTMLDFLRAYFVAPLANKGLSSPSCINWRISYQVF